MLLPQELGSNPPRLRSALIVSVRDHAPLEDGRIGDSLWNSCINFTAP